MSMISRIEQISMNAWPSLYTVMYDGWVLRISDGITRRANSISPLFGSERETEEKIRFCEEFYSSKGLPVIYKMTSRVCPADLDRILEVSGYQRDAETSVRTVSTGDFDEIDSDIISIGDTFSGEWLDRFLDFNGYRSSSRKGFENIMKQIVFQCGFLDLTIDGQYAGCGLGVIEGNHVGLFDIVVAPGYRRRGYGQTIVESLISWGRMNGADTAYLQVMTDNPAAGNLYSRIGFTEVYKYWYRIGREEIR